MSKASAAPAPLLASAPVTAIHALVHDQAYGIDATRIRAMHRYAGFAAMAGIAVGVLVLFGWVFDLPALTRVMPGFPTMKANTALGFLFSGLSLWIAYRAKHDPARRSTATSLALVPLLIGAGTLLEYGIGNFGIDEWLVEDRGAPSAYPGRPSPITACVFVLLGCGLVALRVEPPQRRQPSQYLALAAIAVSGLGLLGYLYDAPLIRSHPSYSSMAIHTVITALVLSTGLLVLHVENGPMRVLAAGTPGGYLIRRLIPATLMFAITLGWLRLRAQAFGLIDTEFGIVIMVTLITSFVIATSVATAHSIDRVDRERSRAATASRIWSLVFEHAEWGVALRSADGLTLETVNSAFARMHGYRPEELAGKAAADLYLSEDGDQARGAVREALLKGHLTQEVRRRRKDGSSFPALLDLAPIRDERGTVVAFVANVQDVSILKRAEERALSTHRELEELSHRLHLAVRAADIGIWDWDVRSNVVTWDAQMYALYGVTPGSAVSYSTWTNAVLPEDLPAAEQTLRRTIDGKTTSDNHFRIRHPVKGIRHIDASEEAIAGSDGTVVRVVGVNMDVSAQRNLEALLRSREERLRLSFECSAVGSAIVSLSGAWISVNPALCAMIGYSRDELLARDFQSVTHPDDLQSDVDLIRQLTAAEIPSYNLEKRYIHKDGHWVWVRISVALARDAENAPLHFVVHVEDITDRKHAEARAVTATRELEAFSYSVAHDLRSPLRAINGFSQILLRSAALQSDADAREYLGQICDASKRMGQLIDDLLSLSRVGRAELRREPVDLSALAREVAGQLRRDDPQRQVEFVIEDRLSANCDRRLLQIALENLLGNAWKYSSKHASARIEFGSEQAGPQTAFYVRDDGAGFDMKHVSKLFGPFQRLHSLDEFEGTGIGLATVHRIIQRHGGSIAAEGKVGAGAKFTFTLG